MRSPETRTPPTPDRASSVTSDHAGDRIQTILPSRPVLSPTGERLLAQIGSTDFRPRLPQCPPLRRSRIGEVSVTGQLTLSLPKDATAQQIRALFATLQSLPDGVSVIVRIPASRWVAFDGAMAGMDDIPTLELVVEGSVRDYHMVADAVTALRASVAQRAAELRAVAS